MALRIEDLSALPADLIRSLLPEWVASHVEAAEVTGAPLVAALRGLLDSIDDAGLLALRQEFAGAGAEYRLYPADPLARRITRLFMGRLTGDWRIAGGDSLDRFLATGPHRRMIVCNHLSYADTQVTDSVLALAGRADFADRLVAIAGPKVYTDAWRRMAAISLNTRKTAQSSVVATEQNTLSPRELAVVALETISDCERRMDEGFIVLLYPEGTRSRDGRLQSFLKAAGRYLCVPDLQVLPMAQTGTERIFPIDSPIMFRHPVRIGFGEPFVASAYPGKSGPLEEAHRRVGALLPAV